MRLSHANKDLPCILFPACSNWSEVSSPEKAKFDSRPFIFLCAKSSLKSSNLDFNPSHAKAAGAARNIFLS